MNRKSISVVVSLLALASLLAAGCQTSSPCDNVSLVPDVPRELCMATHPPYTIAAPDILLVAATRVIPTPPYRLSPMDMISVSLVRGLKKDEPFQGVFPVEADGGVNFGPEYG